MTLPTLTPCTVPDCRAPITHWHNVFGDPEACTFAMRGDPCPNGYQDNPCHAPRATSPLHLPDVDTVAQAIYESKHGDRWYDEHEHVKDEYRRAARVALDLIADLQPVWHRVEPGARVEEGQRWRTEGEDGGAAEGVSTGWWIVPDNNATTYVLHAPPAPETRDSIVREFAAELDRIYTARTAGDGTWMGVLGTLVNRLDALGGEGK